MTAITRFQIAEARLRMEWFNVCHITIEYFQFYFIESTLFAYRILMKNLFNAVESTEENIVS